MSLLCGSRIFHGPRRKAMKHARGHAVVVSGPAFSTGAARLRGHGSVRARRRPRHRRLAQDAVAVNASQLTAVMVRVADYGKELAELLADEREECAADRAWRWRRREHQGKGDGGAGEQRRNRPRCRRADASFASAPKRSSLPFAGAQIRSRSRRMRANLRVSSARSARGPNSKPPAPRARAQAPLCC
mgnify:CR=1 FL=1